MSSLQIDVAEFAGVVAEGILYGIYVMLVGLAGYLLVNRKRSGKNMHYPMIVTVCLMFTIVTAQIVLDVWNLFVAFFHHDTREERIAYLKSTTSTLFQVKHYMMIVMLVVGDSFVAYRCYIIWGKRLWIVVPSMLMSAASLTCGIIAMVELGDSPSHTVARESKWLTCLWTLSLGANALSTSLLAYKIWQVDKANKVLLDASGSGLVPIIRIVVESGALNATYLLIYTITLVTGTEALETVAEMSTVMFGVIATMLIVRVQINTERELRYTTGRPLTTLRFHTKPLSTLNFRSMPPDSEKGVSTQYTTFTLGDESASSTAVEPAEQAAQKA